MSLDIETIILHENKIKKNVFQFINTHQFDKLKEYILAHKSDNYNIQDSNKTFLLEYLIIFGRYDIIKILIDLDVYIDIKDEHNKSILYNIIKFNHMNILELILEKEKKLIGVNILNLKDNNGECAIFYAIQFENINALQLIIKYTTNFLIKNNEGNTILHKAIENSNIEILEFLLQYIKNINITNNNNETLLHIAIKNENINIINYLFDKNPDLNIKTKLGFSILHYIFIKGNIEIFKIVLSKIKKYNLDFNPNIQDKSGNTFFHYLSNKFIKLLPFLELIHFDFNYNIYNIDGNTGLQIILENLTNTDLENKNIKKYVIDIIKKSDLNIQNLYGFNPLFMLVKNNIWLDEEIYNVLLTKKLNIFVNCFDVINKKKFTILDFISYDNYDKFIDLITKSYINQLYGDKNWTDYWDNKCKKSPHGIKLENLNETEKELLKNLNIDNKKEDVCYNIIYTKLKKYIEEYKNSIAHKHIKSYPQTIVYNNLIPTYNKVSLSTARGTSIDILSGLFYLQHKYKNISTILDIIHKKNIIECDKVCEINNIEIKWLNKNLIFPETTTSIIDHIKHLKKDFFIIPLGIEINDLEHANYIIINIKNKLLYRFEPHGSDPPSDMDYDSILLDRRISNYFHELNFTYYTPNDYLPKIGLQFKEIKESKNEYIGDPDGFCAMWCVWWCEIYIQYDSIPLKKLIILLMMEITNNEYTYRELIRNFSDNIVQIRDTILKSAGLDINLWLTDKYTNDQINDLEKIIKSKLE